MAFSREMNGIDHQADNTTSICRLVFSCLVQFRTLNARYIRVRSSFWSYAPFSLADFSHALIVENAHQFFSVNMAEFSRNFLVSSHFVLDPWL